MCGRTIDRYELLEWVGGGGFGAVYKARHTIMHRTVALKLVRPSVHQPPDVIERFVTEARAAASIGNPHIIEVFDAGGVPDGTHFLAMELIDGCSLGRLLHVEETVPVDRAGKIILQVLDALIAAHEAGIVHRDIKPGNIMLVGTQPGGPARDFVKLLDFGISKAAYLQDTPTTKTGMSMGTPGYAAPEQYMAVKTVDHRADLYAACVVLYKMLAGRLPFEADSYEAMVIKVCTTTPTPLAELRPDLSAGLVGVIHKGMSTQPDHRYATAAALRRALDDALAGREETHTVPSGSTPISSSGEHPVGSSGAFHPEVVAAASSQALTAPPARSSTPLWIAVGVGLGLAVGAGIGGYVLLRGDPGAVQPEAGQPEAGQPEAGQPEGGPTAPEGPTDPAPADPAPDPDGPPEAQGDLVIPDVFRDPASGEPSDAPSADAPDAPPAGEPSPEPSGGEAPAGTSPETPTPHRPGTRRRRSPAPTPTPLAPVERTPEPDPFRRPDLVPF